MEATDNGGDASRRMERRDGRAIAQLYDRHGRLVYAAVLSIVRNQAAAEDLVQETFLRAWKRAQISGEQTGAVGPWLLAVARSLALDYVKSQDEPGSTPAAFEDASLYAGVEAFELSLEQVSSAQEAPGPGAPSAAPPARLRRRLLASVGVPERHYGWPVAWAAAALLCLSAAVYFGGRERQYAEESLRLRRQLGDQTTELHGLQEVFAVVNAPGTIEVAFSPASATGRVFVNPSHGVVLIASNLPPAPAGRLYEMWMVSKSGVARSAGLFQSSNDGTAIHIEPGAVDLSAAADVTVTLQDEAGASQPATEPVIVAPLPAARR
ncbi:MAG: sigma-70 family RNA polymerase sigma factor [Bryobacteraceae bacterium]